MGTGSSGRFSSTSTSSEITVNPVLTQEYLDAHDAVLLCGPYKLNQFIDASGQIAILTLSSHELMQSSSRNFLVHMKYIPSVTQVITKITCKKICLKRKLLIDINLAEKI